jgi:hypothetical protein
MVVIGVAPSAGEGTGAGTEMLSSVEPSPDVVAPETETESGFSAARFFNRQ